MYRQNLWAPALCELCLQPILSPYRAHIEPISSPYRAHIATQQFSTGAVAYPRPRVWARTASRLWRFFSPDLKGRTSFQPGLALKARPCGYGAAPILGCFVETHKFCLDGLLIACNCHYLLSLFTIPIPRSSRSTTVARPSASSDSNSGGVTFLLVMALRVRAKS